MNIYLIGSLANPQVPILAQNLRNMNFSVFDDWHAAGEFADREWEKYERARGHSYREALAGHAANHVFEYDKFHLDRCDVAVLLMPAGKSGHLEFGYMIGQGKKGYILFPEGDPERWDVMVRFATGIFTDANSLYKTLVDSEAHVNSNSTSSGALPCGYSAPWVSQG